MQKLLLVQSTINWNSYLKILEGATFSNVHLNFASVTMTKAYTTVIFVYFWRQPHFFLVIFTSIIIIHTGKKKKKNRVLVWIQIKQSNCYQHIWNWNFPNEQKTARKSETFVIFSKLRLENVQVIQIDLRLAVIMFTAGVMMPTFFKLERSSKLTGLVGEPISLYLTIFMKSDEIKVWLLGYCMDIFGMVMSFADLWHFQKNF